MDANKVTVCTKCKRCGKTYKFRVFPEDLQKYRDGELIQDAFPYISADIRELLVSGICPDCWDVLFGQYE